MHRNQKSPAQCVITLINFGSILITLSRQIIDLIIQPIMKIWIQVHPMLGFYY